MPPQTPSASTGKPRAKASARIDDPAAPPLERSLQSLEWYRDNFREFCRDCLSIVNKHGRIVPLLLNSTQLRVLRVIDQLRAANIPPRLVILKARQTGVSTLSEALLFHACLTRPDWSSLVIAHNMKSSRVLFRIGRNYHRWLPGPLHQKKRIDNVHEIEFDSGSRMQVEVQGDPRGYTAQGVLMSEFGFYDQPEDTLIAVMQTMPRIVESIGIIESTAKGVGTKFHKLWQRAQGLSLDREIPQDEKGWYPIFVPWFDHEEYRMALSKHGLDPNPEELALMRDHRLDRTQIKWRRWCIASNLDGDEDRFGQEYPATDQEAFAKSGRPAFDTRAVQYYTELVGKAVKEKTLPPTCEIESDPPGVGKFEIVEHHRGRLRIFAQPQDRHTYVVGADPSEGDPGSDPSPLAVLDDQTMDIVATWYGKAPPDVLACHAIDLARYFKEALIINEANNHGILFHETVRQLGYDNLYFRKTTEDSVAGEITLKPGYLSTLRNRAHLFNTLRKYVRMRMGKIPCPHVVAQMQSLIFVDNRADAAPGAEKDLLIAVALCLMAHRGSMANPLEPFPESVIRQVADEALLLRERGGAEAAERFVLDRTGLTFDDVQAQQDRILEDEVLEKRFGIGGMH